VVNGDYNLSTCFKTGFFMLKKTLIISFLVLIILAIPKSQTVALERDRSIQDARLQSTLTNVYNINTTVLNAQGSQIIGSPLPPSILKTITDMQNYIKELKNRLKNRD